MYQIICDDKILYDSRSEDRFLINPKLTLEANKTGTLTFSKPKTNPIEINKLKSVIEVYQDDTLIFSGRALNDEKDFYCTGKINAEGELAYLLDSIMRPYNFQGKSVKEILERLIENHNEQVMELKKQFKVGKVTVKDNDLMDSNDYRSNDGYNKTWKIISDKLIKKLGGYIQVRRVGNIKYLDYLNEYKENSQCIRFRKNLLDLTQCTSAKDIVTCLIPIGKKDSKGNHINISSVNNNTDYIYDKTAVSLYGWIWGIKEFSDIDNESVLLNKAKKYLKDCVNLALTLELSAIDLNMLDVNIERIKVGDRIRVISELHGLDKYFLVTKMSIDLSNPTNNKIVLGDTIVGITEKQIEAQKGASVRLENMNLNIIDAKKNISNVDEKINEVNAEVGSTREELKRQRDFILIGM